MKTALITGVTGQDGSYLAEFLLHKGYDVHGMVRRASTNNHERIKDLIGKERFTLHYGDLLDSASITSLISMIQPDEIYNLGAQSHVGTSFKVPIQTAEVTGLGALRILEAMREVAPRAKFYQASSSELFGNVAETPQNEETPFNIRSPYGAAKLFAYWITRNYRDSYQMFACNGILFNHESPRRGENFVTKKVVKHLVEVWQRKRDILEIGNMDSMRDWGFAGDYVEAMWLMLQQDDPDDYVIATGKMYSVRQLIERVSKHLGWEIQFEGEGEDEVGFELNTGQILVRVNPEFYRPAEVELLLGNNTKAQEKLGWKPRTSFDDLVEMMVNFELGRAH